MFVNYLLMEREMKQRQYITTFSLIVALTGLSPVMAADAGRTSAGERGQPDQKRFESTLGYKLSPEQMDKVHGGTISPVKPLTVLAQDMYGNTLSHEDWMNRNRNLAGLRAISNGF